MRWVLRFVGCYVGGSVVALLVYRQIQMLPTLPGLREWRVIVPMLPGLVGFIVAVGVFFQRRFALWALIILPLCPSVQLLQYPNWYESGLAWVRQFPIGALYSFLAWCLCQRAERFGALLPRRRDFSPDAPAGNDMTWLVRGLGTYLLAAVLNYVISALLGKLSALRGYSPMDFPATAALAAISTAAVAVIAVPMAFGRWQMLLPMGVLYLIAPFIGLFANRWDMVHHAQYGKLALPSAWPMMAGSAIYGLAFAMPLFVLRRRIQRAERGDTGIATAGGAADGGV